MIAEQAGTSPEVRAALGRLRAAYERQAYSRDGWTATAADVDLVLGALRSASPPSRRVIADVAPRSLVGTLGAPRLAFGWSPPGSG